MEDYPSLAEGNGLENRQACKGVRGFESHILLRQPMYIGGFFMLLLPLAFSSLKDGIVNCQLREKI